MRRAGEREGYTLCIHFCLEEDINRSEGIFEDAQSTSASSAVYYSFVLFFFFSHTHSTLQVVHVTPKLKAEDSKVHISNVWHIKPKPDTTKVT